MLKKKPKLKSLKHKTHDTDTGSSEVQIALLSEEIGSLSGHLKTHPKTTTLAGSFKDGVKKKKLLDYLGQTDEKRYHTIVKNSG